MYFTRCVICGNSLWNNRDLLIFEKGICQYCERAIVNIDILDSRYDEVKERLKLILS